MFVFYSVATTLRILITQATTNNTMSIYADIAVIVLLDKKVFESG